MLYTRGKVYSMYGCIDFVHPGDIPPWGGIPQCTTGGGIPQFRGGGGSRGVGWDPPVGGGSPNAFHTAPVKFLQLTPCIVTRQQTLPEHANGLPEIFKSMSHSTDRRNHGDI